MRFLLRLAVLALAAVGAKALYDRLAPKAAELRGPASDMLDSAKSAARGVTEHATTAASEVADDARQQVGDVAGRASGMAQPSPDEEPTVATPTSTPA